jgi:hypothetical protein
MTLPEFYEQIKDCQKCTLAASRTQVVFGHGNAQADIMFVGEAPGFHEDRQTGMDTISLFIWWCRGGHNLSTLWSERLHHVQLCQSRKGCRPILLIMYPEI